MTEWREVKLGDVAEITSSKRIFMTDYVTKGIPFYRSKEIIEKHKGNDISTELFISEDKYNEIRNKFSVPIDGDILLTSVGTLGIPYIVKNNERFYFKDGNLTWIKKSGMIYPLFLYYFFISQTGKNKLESISIGTTQKAITIIGLKNITIALPPLNIQKKIAGVLGALDDKIELNNKINQNLEAQAQALFKSWFIDFEPFGGKMPNDWIEKSLEQFCKIFTGRKNANEYIPNGINPFFTCAPEPLRIDSYIYDGPAIIIAGNGAYTGRTRFYKGKFDLYQRTYACTLLPDVKQDYIYLLYIIVKSLLQEKIMGGTHGSAIPYIVMNDISKFNFMYNENIFDQLSPILRQYVEKILINEKENTCLSELRDTLLPKLMNGEIDVDNVKID